MRRGARLVAAFGVMLALGGCDKKGSGGAGPDPTTAPPATDSTAAAPTHATPDGAMLGLLAAMRAGDNEAVLEWITPEPPTDRNSVIEMDRANEELVLPSKLYWEVDERHVTGVTAKGEDAADVRLDGYIVWCTGAGPDDPKSACSTLNGSGDRQTTTYAAIRVETQWYVRLDLDRSKLFIGNPGRAGKAG